MDDKDFSARVLSVLKNNLFEMKKLLFNLDDCVAKADFENLQADFEDLQKKFSAAQSEREQLQDKKINLEHVVACKISEIADLREQNSNMSDKINHLGIENNELKRKKFSTFGRA